MKNNMKLLKDYNDFSGKRVLMRVDFNVEVHGGKVTEDFRIQKTIPTIRYVRERGAEVILIAHFENEEDVDFKIVSDYVSEIIPLDYCESFEKNTIEKCMENSQSKIVLLQNLRKHPGEKKNDADFAESLASLADIYINEAFSASHREHASIVGVPKYIPGYAGFVFETEVRELSKAIKPPENSLFILGGAKIETKMPLIKSLAEEYDHIFIGGVLANTVLKHNGIAIGKSVYDKGKHPLPENSKCDFIIPTDVVVETEDGKREEKNVDDILRGDTIYDAGKKTVEDLVERIANAEFVLWNGPLGYYEKDYTEPTLTVARAIAESTSESILGGGDTIAAISSLGLMDAYNHVSTGGGAMLDFLADGKLPGIDALE